METDPSPSMRSDESDIIPFRHQSDIAPRIAITITAIVILSFFAIGVTYFVRDSLPPSRLTTGVFILAMVLCLQLCHSFPTLVSRLRRYHYVTLALQMLLTYVPFLYFGKAWLGTPGFLAASALLILPTAAAWIGLGLVVASVGVIQFIVGYGVSQVAYNMIATLITGLVVYGLSRMAGLVKQLHQARAELARIAVGRERQRFARDLHDLLGYSLSSITLKCEIAHRLTPLQPTDAQQELTEVLQIARQALADVRAVARGFREMSFSAEALSIRSMLATVGIETDVAISTASLPPPVDSILAMVLREGITNMLRHSKPKHCVIRCDVSDEDVHFALLNDGVTAHVGLPENDEGGSGIANLAVRVQTVGGRLCAGMAEDGQFQLRTRIPTQNRPPRDDSRSAHPVRALHLDVPVIRRCTTCGAWSDQPTAS